MSTNKEDPLMTAHSAHGQYKGIVPHRHTTDPIFLFLIIGTWIAMTVIGYQGIQSGNPYRIFSPISDQGQICGQTTSVENEPYLYPATAAGVGICVSACPTNTSALTSTNPNDYYCLNSITESISTESMPYYIENFCFVNSTFNIDNTCGCMLKFNSKSSFHWCQMVDPAIANHFYSQRAVNYLTSFIRGMFAVPSIIFGFGIGFTILIGFLFTSLLRNAFLSSVFIWSLMFGVLCSFALLCGLAYNTAKGWENENPKVHTHDEIVGLQVAAALSCAFGVLWAIFMICARSAIQLAITLLSLTAECMDEMPLIIATPFIQITGTIVFLVPWVIYCVFVGSTGTYVTTGERKCLQYVPGTLTCAVSYNYEYQQYELDQSSQERLWFLFFCYLWTTEFIIATGMLVISIATAHWYFSTKEDRSFKGGFADLCRGWCETLRYHLGTAAFGSLIIAILTFIQSVLLYLEKQFKKNINNPLVRCVFCCVNCCIACIKCIVRNITTQAYIQTAIHSNSLCFAAKDAIFLILRNILRISVLETLTRMAMFVNKLLMVSITGALTYFILQQQYQYQIEDLVGPTVLTMFISFAIASAFTSTFHSIAETMLQCYLTDLENNGGNPVYTSDGLRTFVKSQEMTQEDYDTKETKSSLCCCKRNEGDIKLAAPPPTKTHAVAMV